MYLKIVQISPKESNERGRKVFTAFLSFLLYFAYYVNRVFTKHKLTIKAGTVMFPLL